MTKRKTPDPVRRSHMMRALKVMMAERGFIDKASSVDEAAIEAAEASAAGLLRMSPPPPAGEAAIEAAETGEKKAKARA